MFSKTKQYSFLFYYTAETIKSHIYSKIFFTAPRGATKLKRVSRNYFFIPRMATFFTTLYFYLSLFMIKLELYFFFTSCMFQQRLLQNKPVSSSGQYNGCWDEVMWGWPNIRKYSNFTSKLLFKGNFETNFVTNFWK